MRYNSIYTRYLQIFRDKHKTERFRKNSHQAKQDRIMLEFLFLCYFARWICGYFSKLPKIEVWNVSISKVFAKLRIFTGKLRSQLAVLQGRLGLKIDIYRVFIHFGKSLLFGKVKIGISSSIACLNGQYVMANR